MDITTLQAELDEKVGRDEALIVFWHQAAADAHKLFSSSLISAQYPGRTEKFLLVDSDVVVPDIETYHFLVDALMTEIEASAEIATFSSEVIATNGVAAGSDVTRFGKFNVVGNGEYLRFQDGSETLHRLPHSLPWRFQRLLAGYPSADSINRIAIDPTMGSMLDSFAKQLSVSERIRQGGGVGLFILILGAIGFVVFLLRFIFLWSVGRAIKRQLKNSTAIADNPLGRCWRVCHEKVATDYKWLELKLDEVIIFETARIERWQGVLKLVAAIAPLLGLLGTVIGMIETFQSIAVVGTNDPKFMAAGISKALVTTMLGLVVAVPMLLMHSMLAARSQALIEVLEEQSAGRLAKRMESGV